MLPVLEGREAGVLFEFPEKIPEIIKTAVQTDVHNGLISGLKKDDGLFDPVFVDIGYRGFPEYFLEKTAEILFIHIGVFRQVPYVNFILVMIPYKFQRRFYDPDTVVVCFFRMGQQGKRGKGSQDLQKACPDKKLRGHVFGDGFIFPGKKKACLMKDVQDIQIFFFYPGKCRMCDVQKTGKQDLSFGKRLEKLGLGQIVVLKI